MQTPNWLSPKLANKQQGAALILMAFIIGLAAVAYMLHALDPQRLRLEQDKKNMQTLNEAKQALIAWSVSHPFHPGQMPFPDRNADGNYDGNSDCNSPVSTFTYSFLIGQLPILGQTSPCISPQEGLAEAFKDAQGNRLWYAVSRNLTHKYENFDEFSQAVLLKDPVINPDINQYPIANPDSNNYSAIKDNIRSYPWLKVVDANGSLISDRVAAVIIAPGSPIGIQNRAAAAPSIAQYLDGFVKNGVSYSNALYTQADQIFVSGQDSATVKSNDSRFVHPYYFNDKLVYITVDELMDAIARRALYEASKVLNQYKAKAGHFPYAAPLGSVLQNHTSNGTSQSGLLPIDGTDICTCASPSSCSCSFNAITKVTLTRGSGTWASTQVGGACSRYSANCNCVGAGSCFNGTEYFTCDSAGNCDTNLGGSNSFTYTVPDYANLRKLVNNGCATPVGKQISCTDAGQFAIGLDVPDWFKDNLWQDFLYYNWSNSNNISLGARSGISAILINVGAATTNELGHAQTRPSASIDDYLDSAINTDGGTASDPMNIIFDATTQQKTSNYNDQSFIVAP